MRRARARRRPGVTRSLWGSPVVPRSPADDARRRQSRCTHEVVAAVPLRHPQPRWIGTRWRRPVPSAPGHPGGTRRPRRGSGRRRSAGTPGGRAPGRPAGRGYPCRRGGRAERRGHVSPAAGRRPLVRQPDAPTGSAAVTSTVSAQACSGTQNEAHARVLVAGGNCRTSASRTGRSTDSARGGHPYLGSRRVDGPDGG